MKAGGEGTEPQWEMLENPKRQWPEDGRGCRLGKDGHLALEGEDTSSNNNNNNNNEKVILEGKDPTGEDGRDLCPERILASGSPGRRPWH